MAEPTFGGEPVAGPTFGGVPIPQLDRPGGPGMEFSGPKDSLSQFLSGFNEQTAGFLDTLASTELRREAEESGRQSGRFSIPSIPNPIGMGAELIRRHTIGRDPQNIGDRIFRRAGQEVSATVPLAAEMFLLGPMAAASKVPTAGGQVLRTMGQGIVNTPGTAALGELASATGAGAGAGLAEYMAPGNVYAEMGGQLGGGFAPVVFAYTPTAFTIRMSRWITSRFSPSVVTRAAQQEAAKVIGSSMMPEERRALDSALQLERDIPGFAPSLGEATQSPALLATQRMFERQATGPDLEQLTARRQGNIDSIEMFAQDRAPDAPSNPSHIVDTAARRVRDVRLDLETQQADIQIGQEGIADTLPKVDRFELGSGLRSRMNEIRDSTRETLAARADELGLNNYDLTVHFDDMRGAILEDFRQKYLFEDMPPEVVQLVDSVPDRVRARALADGESLGLKGEELDAFVEQNARFTFGDLKSLRERVSDDLIDAMSNTDAGARSRRRSLVLLQQKIDEFIEAPDGFQAVLPPEFAHNWQIFRQEYFNQYIEPFEKGVAFDVRQRDGRGFYTTRDERVADAFFEAGNVSAARQFKSAFGDDPDATAALASSAMDNLRDFAVRDGVVVSRRLDTWMRNHENVLNEFPNIQRAVSGVSSASQALSVRQGQLNLRLKRVNDSILARRIQAYMKGTQTPEQFIDSALGEPRFMRSVMASLRDDPGAVESLRRHVWDLATDMSPQGLQNFLEGRSKSLAVLFNTRHLSDLIRIQQARIMVESLPAPGGQGFRPDPIAGLTRMVGQGVPAIQSRILHAEAGRLSYRVVAADMFSRFMRGRMQMESEALLREALYNPEVAKSLGDMIDVTVPKPASARRLNVWLFNLGLGGRGPLELSDDNN